MKRVLSSLFAAALTASFVFAQDAAPKTEESVRPGINEKFLDPNLKVDDWLKRFEVESREVFDARAAVLEACKIKPGMAVADVGAGTGLYTRLFSKAAGEKGWVYAVDINARFLEHIQARAKQDRLKILARGLDLFRQSGRSRRGRRFSSQDLSRQ